MDEQQMSSTPDIAPPMVEAPSSSHPSISGQEMDYGNLYFSEKNIANYYKQLTDSAVAVPEAVIGAFNVYMKYKKGAEDREEKINQERVAAQAALFRNQGGSSIGDAIKKYYGKIATLWEGGSTDEIIAENSQDFEQLPDPISDQPQPPFRNRDGLQHEYLERRPTPAEKSRSKTRALQSLSNLVKNNNLTSAQAADLREARELFMVDPILTPEEERRLSYENIIELSPYESIPVPKEDTESSEPVSETEPEEKPMVIGETPDWMYTQPTSPLGDWNQYRESMSEERDKRDKRHTRDVNDQGVRDAAQENTFQDQEAELGGAAAYTRHIEYLKGWEDWVEDIKSSMFAEVNFVEKLEDLGVYDGYDVLTRDYLVIPTSVTPYSVGTAESMGDLPPKRVLPTRLLDKTTEDIGVQAIGLEDFIDRVKSDGTARVILREYVYNRLRVINENTPSEFGSAGDKLLRDWAEEISSEDLTRDGFGEYSAKKSPLNSIAGNIFELPTSEKELDEILAGYWVLLPRPRDIRRMRR